MLGVKAGRELEIAECEGMAVDLEEGERKRRGIVGRLPRTLVDARAFRRTDQELCPVLGKDFVEKYLSVNEVRFIFIALIAAYCMCLVKILSSVCMVTI